MTKSSKLLRITSMVLVVILTVLYVATTAFGKYVTTYSGKTSLLRFDNLLIYNDHISGLEVRGYKTGSDVYARGESLGNLTVVVKYQDGRTKTLQTGEYQISGFDSSTPGIKTVTVTYTERGIPVNTTFTVRVKAITNIAVELLKETFGVDYVLQPSDFLVTAMTNTGEYTQITDGSFDISKKDPLTKADNDTDVTITYTDGDTSFSKTFKIKVMSFTNLDDTIDQYWFFDGNFNVSGWSHLVVNGAGYATYVGQTYNAPGGEVVTGFNTSWDTETYPPNGTVGNNGATGCNNTAMMAEGRYDLTIDNASPYTTLGINCLAGYSSKDLLGMGYYFYEVELDANGKAIIPDTPPEGALSTLQYASRYSAPSLIIDETNCGAPDGMGFTLLDYLGPYNVYTVVELTCYNFQPGKSYLVCWVAVFESGIKHVSEWTVNMKEADPENDAAFVDTAKPNANVIIMAGQSNMFGASPLTQAIKDSYHKTYENVFLHYRNINFVSENSPELQTDSENIGFEQYKVGFGGQGDSYFGPELAMIDVLHNNSTGQLDGQWYVIKYAAAGTALGVQWLSPCIVDGNQTTLLDDMIAYVQASLDVLEDQGFDVRVRGFMWMQGESDAANQSLANAYEANEQHLLSEVRTAFAKYATRHAQGGDIPGSGIAFINAGIALNPEDKFASNGDGGPNDWIYAEEVNTAKIENSYWLCSATIRSTENPLCPAAGLLADRKFCFFDENGDPQRDPTTGEILTTPTIKNTPETYNGTVNSIYIDTFDLLSKYAATNEYASYPNQGEAEDWAHYSPLSMINLGNLFGACMEYLVTQGS